jgi:hypothetical protein
MGDMGKIEHITTDWVEELRWRAGELRRESREKSLLADQLDDVRRDFEKRVEEHEKWKPKKEPADG